MRATGFPRTFFGLLVLCLLAWSCPAWSQIPGPVVLAPALRTLDLKDHMMVLDDAAGALGPAEISSLPPAPFKPAGEVRDGGYVQGARWHVFFLENPTTVARQVFIEVERQRLNFVDLYSADGKGDFLHQMAGNHRPFALRPLPYRTALFPLTVPPGATRQVLLRVESKTPMVVRATLWEPGAFAEKSSQDGLLLGSFYGIASLLVIFSAASVVIAPRRQAFWFLLHLISFVIRQLDASGQLAQFLMPDQPFVAERLGNFSNCAVVATGSLFVAASLDLNRVLPWVNRLFMGIAGICLALAVAAVADYWNLASPVINIITILFVILSIMVILACLQRGRRTDQWVLLVAMSVSFVSGLLRMGQNIGIAIPFAWGEWGLYFGFDFYLIFMGVAVWQYLRRIEGEKLEASRLLLAATEKRGEDLNQLVILRTADLEKALLNEQETRQRLQLFVQMATHEFKTPLTAIDSAAQVMELIVEPHDLEMNSRLALIRRSVRQVETLVDTCLLGERYETLSARFAEFCPADCLGRVLERHAQEGMPPITLSSVDLPDRWEGDADLLGIALDALVDNALRYAGRDKPLEIVATGTGNTLAISVCDRGPGVPSGEAAKIFLKYYRGTQSHRASGTGLGLYLVEEVALLHNGRASYTPRPGGGAVFTLSLPPRQS